MRCAHGVSLRKTCALGHASCNMPVRHLHGLLTNTMCTWGPNRHQTPNRTAGFQPRGAEMTEPFPTTGMVSRATPSSCPDAVAKELYAADSCGLHFLWVTSFGSMNGAGRCAQHPHFLGLHLTSESLTLPKLVSANACLRLVFTICHALQLKLLP